MNTKHFVSPYIDFKDENEYLNSEVWEYSRLLKRRTNLPNDILVDCCYEPHNNHPLWVYVVDGERRIPVTVSETPSIQSIIREGFHVDFYTINQFIIKNRQLLEDLADEKIDICEFCSKMSPLDGVDYAYSKIRMQINEMAKARSTKTGLPTTIWLDTHETYLRHAPRIKFCADGNDSDTRKFASMEILPPNTIHWNGSKNKLTTKELNQIRSFVLANEDDLLLLCNAEIDEDEFFLRIKKVDADGNIISYTNPKNEKNPNSGKLINGFSICELDGQYDYKDRDGNLLFGDYPLDYADNFYQYGDKLLAYVVQGGFGFHINTNGVAVDVDKVSEKPRD